MSKTQMSAKEFRNTRVTSCSRVLVNSGKTVAVAFPDQIPRNVDLNAMKSSETTSMAHDVFKVRPTLHAGMIQKPLESYHPLAHRSRLPEPSVVMPYKNSSQIVLGDRSSHYKRHYTTSNQNVYGSSKIDMCSNSGIVAKNTLRLHHTQNS